MTSSEPPVFDVAISLRSNDESRAEAISSELSKLEDDLNVFVYSERQEEIGGRDGADLFPGVFRTARVCVVLYREDWGDTRVSRMEKLVIRDRYQGEDQEFLLLVRQDDTEELPPWFPHYDMWTDYRVEGPGGVARTILSKLREIERGGSRWSRVTRRTFGREPLPISYYHRYDGGKSTEGFVPVEPEACDGCTTSIRFRPLHRVTLWREKDEPPVTEQFCPPCARKRGEVVSIPPGMDEGTAYASENPTVREHVYRLLSQGVLQALSEDEELNRRGLSKVGAQIGDATFSLTPSGPAKPDGLAFIPWTEVAYGELEAENALSEHKMVPYLRDELLAFLDEKGW